MHIGPLQRNDSDTSRAWSGLLRDVVFITSAVCCYKIEKQCSMADSVLSLISAEVTKLIRPYRYSDYHLCILLNHWAQSKSLCQEQGIGRLSLKLQGCLCSDILPKCTRGTLDLLYAFVLIFNTVGLMPCYSSNLKHRDTMQETLS